MNKVLIAGIVLIVLGVGSLGLAWSGFSSYNTSMDNVEIQNERMLDAQEANNTEDTIRYAQYAAKNAENAQDAKSEASIFVGIAVVLLLLGIGLTVKAKKQ